MTTILDYGMGNLASVSWALDKLGMPNRISFEDGDLESADYLILPGVGSFREAMQNLRERGLYEAIRREVLEKGKPLLGICLGMQLLASYGEEDGGSAGLDLIPGEVLRFQEKGLRIPHTGWNELTGFEESWIGETGECDRNYYFIHTFHFVAREEADVAAWVDYGGPVVASVHKGNVYGTQFHPEKSQATGLKLLETFFKRCA